MLLHFTGLYRIAQCGHVMVSLFWGRLRGIKKPPLSAALRGLGLTLYNRLCNGFDTLVFNDGKQFQRRAAWLFNTPLPC